MNTKLIIFNIITLLALAVVLLHGQGAGTLNPPAAPADGVYRTLEEIYLRAQAAETQATVATARAEAAESEAQAAKSNAQSAFAAASAAYQNTQFLLPAAESRIPIEDLPFTISSPGSYYLRGNLEFTSPSGDAITIASSCVTLDLNGFTLRSGANVTGGQAIHLSGAVENVTIRNGHIRGSSSAATPAGFQHGIGTFPTTNLIYGCQFSDLSVSRCQVTGIGFGGAFVNATLTRCIVSDNHGDGLHVEGSSVSQCVAYRNGGHGMTGHNVYHRCSSNQNGEDGIRGIYGAIVQSSLASDNGSDGFYAGLIIGSVARSNGGTGLHSSVVSQSFAQDNEVGFSPPGVGGTLSFSYLFGNEIDTGGGSPTRTGNHPTP